MNREHLTFLARISKRPKGEAHGWDSGLRASVGRGAFSPGHSVLPRSRHLPVAVVDGNLTENLNKIAVRFWTDSSFDEDGEICRRYLLDPLAHAASRKA